MSKQLLRSWRWRSGRNIFRFSFQINGFPFYFKSALPKPADDIINGGNFVIES
jgi:hypothetical protein